MLWRRDVEHDNERLGQEAKEGADGMKPGTTWQETLRQVRQAEIAANLTNWISSPGLRRPE